MTVWRSHFAKNRCDMRGLLTHNDRYLDADKEQQAKSGSGRHKKEITGLDRNNIINNKKEERTKHQPTTMATYITGNPYPYAETATSDDGSMSVEKHPLEVGEDIETFSDEEECEAVHGA